MSERSNTTDLTDAEFTALCAISYNVKCSGIYKKVAFGLIARGLVREEISWVLTEAGEAAYAKR